MDPTKFAKLRQLALSRGTRTITPKAEPTIFQLAGRCPAWLHEVRGK